MNHDNQIPLPQSFIDLFVPAGKLKPNEPWNVIVERYELCEDMANMLTETAPGLKFQLGVTEEDVLERCLAGLQTPGSGLSQAEATWVACRLAELLGWPMPSTGCGSDGPGREG